jgi:MFS family permease
MAESVNKIVSDQRKADLVGMRAFTVIWLGQVLSLMGTAMTAFALTIWAWQVTGEATALALVGFFSFAPSVLFSPVAGALVDRWNRKLVMILADLGACVSTVIVLLLFATGWLQVWHLYVTGAFAAVFQSFHFPAYSAAVTMIVPKEQYTRASGMISMAQSASGVFAPVFGAILLSFVGLSGVMVVDVVTCLTAIAVVLSVNIPNPPRFRGGAQEQGWPPERVCLRIPLHLRATQLAGLTTRLLRYQLDPHPQRHTDCPYDPRAN